MFVENIFVENDHLRCQFEASIRLVTWIHRTESCDRKGCVSGSSRVNHICMAHIHNMHDIH